MKTTLDHWQGSKPREEIRLFDMESMVTKAAVNTKSSKNISNMQGCRYCMCTYFSGIHILVELAQHQVR